MAFPASSVTPPTLSNWQAYYNGVKFGVGGGAYAFYAITGLFGDAAMRTGDTPRPRDQGEWIGLDLYSGRDFTMDTDVISDGTSVQHALEALGSALQVGGTTENPFYIQLPNLPLLVTMARCRKWDYPINISYGAGLVSPVATAFHSTDPRIYTAPTNTATCGLPTPSAGFKFALAFNLSFGGGTGNNSVTVVNSGNFEMRPIITIAGPCLNPSISNGSITGNPTLQFGFQLNSGDSLVVDLDAHTAVLNGTSSRLNTMQPGFVWWNLPASSTNVISFNSQDTSLAAGTMTVAAPAGAWIL